VTTTHPVDGSSALDAALWYAQAWGALVAPADPIRKKPLIRTGKDHAEHSSRDPDVIRSWRSQWKTAGVRVAVITGPDSGIFALDGDQHMPGVDGVENIRGLERELGPLPTQTPQARTAHGMHIITKYPAGAVIPTNAGKVAPGVDLRGEGGLFIAPPASDRAWLIEAHPEDTPLADLPPAWVAHLVASARNGDGRGKASQRPTPGARILAGQRNATLTSYAGRLRRFGHAAEEILALLRAVNTGRCEPPLPDDEVAAIAASVSRYRPTPPLLNAGDQYLPRITVAAWGAVSAANEPPHLFISAGLPVRLEGTDDGSASMVPLTDSRLTYIAASAALWFKRPEILKPRPPVPPDDPTSALPEGTIAARPPKAVIVNMLAAPSLPLPTLDRIVAAPILTPTGAIADTEGYCAETRTYYAPDPFLRLPALPLTPSDDEIERARELILDELLGQFPFVGESERAHAVALLILPFVREAIDGPTPLHLIEKPTPGTGATLLVDALTFPFLGSPLGTMTEGRDEEEWRKRITATLRNGPAAVLIDNIRHRLDSSALSSAITTPCWEDRVLGASETLRARVRCAWIATGNNPALSGEMARRTVRIRLDAKVDRPWLREGFRHPNLRGWVAERRGEIIRAALTLCRTWVVAGMPRSSATLGMFDSWAGVIGGILETAAIPGFLGNLEELYEVSDAEGTAWRLLVDAWWRKFRDADVYARDLFALLTPEVGDPIPLDLGRGTERSQQTRFGNALSQQRDRQYGPCRIVRTSTKHTASRWRLVWVEP
jgi:hypothetical protein